MVNNPIIIKENGSGGLSLLNAAPIYRLSSSKNVLYLYGSFAVANTIRVGFLLANGVTPDMRKVTPSSVDVDTIIESVDQESGYNLWEYYIPSAVLNAVAAKNASSITISFSESEIEDEADYLGTITSDMVDVEGDLDAEYATPTVGNFANVWEEPNNKFYSWLVTGVSPTVWAKQTSILNSKYIGTTGQLTLSVNASVNSDDEEIDVTVTDIIFDEISSIWNILNGLTGDVSDLMVQADYDSTATGDTVDKAASLDDTSSGGSVTITAAQQQAKNDLLDQAVKTTSSPTFVDVTVSTITTGSGNVDTNLALKEDKANKVIAFSSPTDTQYPSAKLTSDQLALKEVLANKVTAFQATPDDDHYPSEKLMSDKVDTLNARIDLKEDSANKGKADGYVPLNKYKLIDSTYLPSYVDDVLEVDTYADLPETILTFSNLGLTITNDGTYDFTILGLVDGSVITIAGTASNNTSYTVSGVPTATVITLTTAPVDEVTTSLVDFTILTIQTYLGGISGILYVVLADETSGGNTSTYRWATSTYIKITDTLSASEVKVLYESNADTNEYDDAEQAKVANIPSDTNAELLLKVDKSLSDDTDYIPQTASGIATASKENVTQVYIDYDGTPSKMPLSEVYSGANTATGSFVAGSDYQTDGLGAYESATIDIHTLTASATAGLYYTTIKTMETDKIIYFTFPTIASDTNNLSISTAGDLAGQEVLVNGGNIYAEVFSEKTVKFIFDGTNFNADLTELSKEITYDSIVNSTYGTLKPINGIPSLNGIYGLSLYQQKENGNFVDTSGYTVVNTSFSVASNEGSLLATAINGHIQSAFTMLDNHIYYFRALVKADSSLVSINFSGNLGIAYHSGGGSYELLSSVYTRTGGDLTSAFRLCMDGRSTGWTTNYVKEFMVYDITNTPLASKTATQLNAIIPTYFEGEKSISDFTLSSTGVNLASMDNVVAGRLDVDGTIIDDTSTFVILNDYDKLTGTVDFEILLTYRGVTIKDVVKQSTNINISFTRTTGSGYIRRVCYYDYDDNFISYLDGAVTDYNKSFAVPENAYYIRYNIASPNIEDVVCSNIVLNEGTTATTYTAYNSPDIAFKATADLLSVGTSVRDYAYPLNGDWWKDKYVAKYTLVSSDITGVANLTNVQRVIIEPSFSDNTTWTDGADGVTMFNPYTETVNTTALYDVVGGENKYATRSSQDIALLVALSKYADLASAQADLTGKVIYYALETITTEEIAYQGQLIQESVTTLVQGNDNFATEYDIKFNLDSTAQIGANVDRLGELRDDVDENTVDIASNVTNISTNASDITNIETKTDFITVTQSVNLDTIESDLDTAKNDINALESGTAITLTYGTNVTDGGSTNVRYYGNRVTGTFDLDYSAIIGQGTTLATLPTGYTPAVSIMALAYDSGGTAIYIRISSLGAIANISGDTPASGTITFTTTFIKV